MDVALGLSAGGLLWSGLILLAASFVRGYAGFGFSAVLMTGLAFFVPVAQIVPLSIALEVIASLGQARGIFRHILKRNLAILLVAGLLGNPIGVYLLGRLPEDLLRILVYLVILSASLLLLAWTRRPDAVRPVAIFAGGFVAGIVNGATALSGLALALFFTLTGARAAAMRATMIAYFFFTDLWAGGLLVAAGHYDSETWLRVAAALPLLGAGVWLGSRHFIATPPGSFRTYVLWLLLGLSAIGLAQMALR